MRAQVYHLLAGSSLDQILDILTCVESQPDAPFAQPEPELMSHLARITTVACSLSVVSCLHFCFQMHTESGQATMTLMLELRPELEAQCREEAAGRFRMRSYTLKQTLWAGILGGLALLCGCAGPAGEADATRLRPGLAPDRVRGQITVWSWNIAAKSLQGLIPAFERRDPHVQVKVDMTGARMQTRLMLSLAAGVGAPEVSQLQNTDAPHYIATGRLADLTSVAAKYRAMFPASLWNNGTLHGRIYAIPWDMGPCAVYYKRDLFRRYGIDPAHIDTWDDYIHAGQEIVRKSGGHTKMLPLGSNDLQSMFELLIQQSGGQVFDDQGRIAINSPQARRALEIIRQMRQAGICSDVPAYSQEWMAGFNDPTIATYPGAVWLAGMIKDTVGDYASKKAEWGVFRLPAVAHGGLHVANLGGSVLVIPAQCRHKEAAWAFIEYALCTNAGQLAQYRSNSLFPGFLPALATPEMDEPDPFFGGQRVAHLFATDVTLIPRLNRTASWAEATSYLSQDLSHWAATGMPGTDLLAGLAQKLHRRLDRPIAPAALAAADPGRPLHSPFSVSERKPDLVRHADEASPHSRTTIKGPL